MPLCISNFYVISTVQEKKNPIENWVTVIMLLYITNVVPGVLQKLLIYIMIRLCKQCYAMLTEYLLIYWGLNCVYLRVTIIEYIYDL